MNFHRRYFCWFIIFSVSFFSFVLKAELIQEFEDTMVKSCSEKYKEKSKLNSKKIMMSILSSRKSNENPCVSVGLKQLSEVCGKLSCIDVVKKFDDVKFKFSGSVFGQ